ncbi:VRR-NUC domain-containing protein [Mycotypha africana]|uniref:VRR-NUC domain-containing protein n=1 Tax=Mycotypha africana TaxID=64632 RepID=UPI00230175C6|nr:VRR-NUC domain-containing protein [Mycotypha africana]KAI8984563.1 VRR-NUC domain-containing protein [Mycotypha africana]
MRKNVWIRKSKLNYSKNVRDLDETLQDLEKKKFILIDVDNLKEAAQILSKDELKDVLRERNITLPAENSRKLDYEQRLFQFAAVSTQSMVKQHSTIDELKLKKLWDSIHKCLGPCIKVNNTLYDLFRRLQLVYYRINNLVNMSNPVSLSILSKTSKRNYPCYTYVRTNNIWDTRDDLLAYERALLIEKKFEKAMEDLIGFNSSKSKKSPPPSPSPSPSPPLAVAEIPSSSNKSELSQRQQLENIWTFCENHIAIWDDCIIQSVAQNRPYHLKRFEAGWIYTRLVDHGTQILAKLHEYDLEALILKKLLSQRMYRIGKRGKWYDRLALIQTHYLNKENFRLQKKTALKTCIDAIHDNQVHQIYLHGIHKRIKQLEKDLCIPKREQHDFSYLTLKTPKKITIYDELIGKKSIWRSDDGSQCSVEQIALDYYKKQGFKGFHCENSVIRMIAGLLFWDIIYAPIPGVFETPYQIEPLDLRTEAFYESRLDLINKRLRDIEEGKYITIMKDVDMRERPKRTVAVGINWNYELEDIIEITECIGPMALAPLCKLFFEEFDQRQGGMPDLCCWNYEKKECLFSEVKGPNDQLSKTQKMWIETLSSFGINVEVCYVKIWEGEDIILEEND